MNRGVFVPAGLLASSAGVVPHRALTALDQVVVGHGPRVTRYFTRAVALPAA
jgi:hypothetical protein